MILGRIDHILTGNFDWIIDGVDRNSATLAESFQLGSQRVDRSIPLTLIVGVAVWAETLQFRQIRRAQHIQIEVILASNFIDKFTLESQSSEGAGVRIVEEPLLQTRRELLEVGLTGIIAGQHGRRQFVE